MRRRFTVPVAIVVLAAAGAGEGDGPTGHEPLVQAAVDKHDAAVAKASAAYAAAVAAADRQLARESGDVQKRAMRSGDLTTANDAAAVRSEAESDAKRKTPPVDQGVAMGRWVFRDQDGRVSHWVITPTEARHADLNADVGRVSREGSAVVVRWGTEWVDRLTMMADARAAKEVWHLTDGRRYPKDPPNILSVGNRD